MLVNHDPPQYGVLVDVSDTDGLAEELELLGCSHAILPPPRVGDNPACVYICGPASSVHAWLSHHGYEAWNDAGTLELRDVPRPARTPSVDFRQYDAEFDAWAYQVFIELVQRLPFHDVFDGKVMPDTFADQIVDQFHRGAR